MNVAFDRALADGYKSPAQISRVLTEAWVKREAYCPNCGSDHVDRYRNNKPVADFFCAACKEDYELKSKKTALGKKIVDGKYDKMIERLGESTNPNLFLLRYSASKMTVADFMIVPKHFFTPDIIEKRKPLGKNAIRSQWVGCNILLEPIPPVGRIYIIKDGKVVERENVLSSLQNTTFLRNMDVKARGWLLDTMNCIGKLGKRDFTLADVYKFEDSLSVKYPDNNHIKDKLRQQLQILRDKGYLEFQGRGRYLLR